MQGRQDTVPGIAAPDLNLVPWFLRTASQLLQAPRVSSEASDDDDAPSDPSELEAPVDDLLDSQQAYAQAVRVAESVQTLSVRGMLSWPYAVDMLTECARLAPDQCAEAFGGTTALHSMLREVRAPERVSTAEAHRVVTALAAVARLCGSPGASTGTPLHRDNAAVRACPHACVSRCSALACVCLACSQPKDTAPCRVARGCKHECAAGRCV